MEVGFGTQGREMRQTLKLATLGVISVTMMGAMAQSKAPVVPGDTSASLSGTDSR